MRVVQNSYNPRDLTMKEVQAPMKVDALPDELADVIFTKL